MDRRDRGYLLVAKITIEDPDAWSGTSSLTVIGPTGVGQVASAQVTWVFDVTQGPDIVIYRPTGTANISATGCVWAPASGAIERLDGILTVDYSTDPPTYRGAGTSQWPATLSCTDPTFSVSAETTVSFLGGLESSAEGVFAHGSVNPDGKTIEGSSTYGPATYKWKFTRSR